MAAKEKTHVPAAAILGGTRIWASLIAALIVLGAICNIAQADTLAAALVAENSPLGLGRNSGAVCVGVEAIQARRTHQENAGFLGETASDDAYATRGAAQALGKGSTASLSKGTTLARNLREKLAIEQAMASPTAGAKLPLKMTDPRWHASDGWVKMQQVVESGGREGPINVHYLFNEAAKAVDDFKIVLPGRR